MSTAEKPAKLAQPSSEDLALLERMARTDHTHLPDHDGTFVQNFQEYPQSVLLSESIGPYLKRLRPDGRYILGQDSGIYWKLTDPPLAGVKSPDWFYIADVPPTYKGAPRRSYVLWQELRSPLIVLEYVSGDGSEERDRTPERGKFWVYENAIKATYYGIFEADPGRIEMHHRVEGRFRPLEANEHGRYPIPELGLELGLRKAMFHGMDVPWMRWWDAEGNLLLTGDEIAEREAERAGREAERAERLAAQLRALGIEPEA